MLVVFKTISRSLAYTITPPTHLCIDFVEYSVLEQETKCIQTEEKALYRMKVVNSTLKVAHEAVHVSYGSIGGGMLRD